MSQCIVTNSSKVVIVLKGLKAYYHFFFLFWLITVFTSEEYARLVGILVLYKIFDSIIIKLSLKVITKVNFSF